MAVWKRLMTSPRIVGRPASKQRGVMVAAGVLVTSAAIKIGLEMTYKEASFYDMLEVMPGVQSSELKKGYKRASLKVHPDKGRTEEDAKRLNAAKEEWDAAKENAAQSAPGTAAPPAGPQAAPRATPTGAVQVINPATAGLITVNAAHKQSGQPL